MRIAEAPLRTSLNIQSKGRHLIIVTGGAGFIGSNIIKALNEAGEDRILVVDHLGQGEKWKNLLDLSFTDYEHKDDFLAMLERGLFDHGVSAVIHMGACSSTTEQDADYLMANNYELLTVTCEKIRRQYGHPFHLCFQRRYLR